MFKIALLERIMIMAKVRPNNPNDPRSDTWHGRVWDSIEEHGGVAERYEATKKPDGTLDRSQLSSHDQEIIRDAERRASR